MLPYSAVDVTSASGLDAVGVGEVHLVVVRQSTGREVPFPSLRDRNGLVGSTAPKDSWVCTHEAAAL